MSERRRFNPENLNVGLVSAYAMEGVEGGVQQHIRGFKQFLQSKGHNVLVFAPSNPYFEGEPEGVIYLGKAGNHSFRGSNHLARRLPISPFTIQRAKGGISLDVAHFHEPELSAPSLEFLFMSNDANIVTFHSHNEKNWKFRLFWPMGVIWGPKLSGKIAVSQASHDFFNHYFPGDYTIIPNGIDTKRFNPNNPIIDEFADDKVNVLFIGRLEERKGVANLLQAFSRVKARNEDVRLIIVGDGPQRQELEGQVESERIRDVDFVGRVSSDKLPSYYSTADVFCSPATHGESFGITIVEAMASGLPVIAGDNPGYRGVIEQSNNGMLVDPKDIGLFSDNLLRLVDNPDLREQMGKNGYKKAQNYDWNVVGRKILDYYHEVLEKRAS